MVITNATSQEINVVLLTLEKAIEDLKKQLETLQEKVKKLEENH